MAPDIPAARKKLSYPLYGADFDPFNQDFLLVGGGGGSTSSGVPNKISLIDTSKYWELNEITDIELAKNEDSVVTLAVAGSSDTSLTAFAGINSSQQDHKAGKNEHFRSFKIGLPARKRKADGTENTIAEKPASPVGTQALTRAAIFKSATGPANDTYQRVLRLSPASYDGGSRIAAIATRLAPQNEIVTFRATPSPGPSDVISRISLEKSEAEDVDIVTVEDEARPYTLAYCTGYDVYLQRISGGKGGQADEPIHVYEAAQTTTGKPKIRALRFLNSRYLLLLLNRPARKGVDLVILKTDKDYTQAQHILLKRIAKMPTAVGLDVCKLSESAKGEQQFIVAVAGQDSSIQILTIEWIPHHGMGKFKQYAIIQDVHSGPITRTVFSNFVPPQMPVTKNTRPQYIRLASVGVDQTVVVHTMPLRPNPTSGTKTPRYVLTAPTEILKQAINIFVAIFVVATVALAMQAFCEIRGAVPPTLNATNWLSAGMQERIARPYIFANGGVPGPVIPSSMPPIINSATSKLSSAASSIPSLSTVKTSLLDLISAQQETAQQKAIVIRDSDVTGELSTELQHDAEIVKQETLRKWEDLTEKEKKGWKKRLVEAGHWTEQQGESILRGIFFSEVGGFVGGLVRG